MNITNFQRRNFLLASTALHLLPAQIPAYAKSEVSLGLALSRSIIQPFDLRYFTDDRHIMLFFEGHQNYEAVEAMIKFLPNGIFEIRAILTRHDQTQIDHVNSERLLKASESSKRETYLRTIELNSAVINGMQSIQLSFRSGTGESIEMLVVCASAPEIAKGGLSDPGNHARSTSLPVMFRGKSAQAGRGSKLTVDGTALKLPIVVDARPHYLAYKGYFTESHRMAIFRAGNAVYEAIRTPKNFTTGDQWVYKSDKQEKIYAIKSVSADGVLEIICETNPDETLTCLLVGQQIFLQKLQIFDSVGNDFVALEFTNDSRFSIRFLGTQTLVSGLYITKNMNGETLINMHPDIPAWTSSRALSVRLISDEKNIRIRTDVMTQ